MPKGKKRSRSESGEEGVGKKGSRSESGEEGVRKKVRMKTELNLVMKDPHRVLKGLLDDQRLDEGDLKKVVCKVLLQILKGGGRLNIIQDYLNTVKNANDHLSGLDLVPSEEEIKQGLVIVLSKLSRSIDSLVNTPYLSDKELESLYLTPEEAKAEQITKNDWLTRFANNEEILKWLTETISEDEDIPETPYKSPTTLRGEDRWEDLSIIYANTMSSLKSKEKESGVTELMKSFPDNIPVTNISINVGKIEDMDKWTKEFIGSLKDLARGTVKTIINFIMGSSLVALKVSGTFIKITSEFIANLIINLIKSKTNAKLLSLMEIITRSTIGKAPFIICDDYRGIKEKIIHKYELFLTCIVIKISFMLGTIDYVPIRGGNIFSNMRAILNKGIERLNLYNQGELTKEPSEDIPVGHGEGPYLSNLEDRDLADQYMRYMNKYTEWYLLRKTSPMVVATTESLKSDKVLYIGDRPSPSEMTVEQIARYYSDGDSASPMEMDVDPTGQSKKKKKNTKKRKRKSNTKNRKRKPNTKKRKKIKKKTKQKRKK